MRVSVWKNYRIAMTAVLVLAGSLIILGFGVALWNHLHPKGDDDETIPAGSSCATCDGSDAKCEQECMLEAATKAIEYFDDEELDRFKGRQGSDYSDEETEQFRDVLYTMRRQEAAAWNRSLILRGIEVPDQLKDELIMMIKE